MTWRNASGLFRVLAEVVGIVLVLASPGCEPKKKAGAAPLSSAETAALTGVPMNTPAPVETEPALAAPPDPLKPADHVLVDRTKDAARDLDDLVKRGLLADPSNPGEGAVARCAVIESERAQLEALPDADGDFKKLVAETQRLCSLEVPIIACNEALRQASLSPSQASHRLVCNFAQKDFAKARATKPNDRRVFELGQRLGQSCR